MKLHEKHKRTVKRERGSERGIMREKDREGGWERVKESVIWGWRQREEWKKKRSSPLFFF